MFNRKIYYKWQFSIAMLVYQRASCVLSSRRLLFFFGHQGDSTDQLIGVYAIQLPPDYQKSIEAGPAKKGVRHVVIEVIYSTHGIIHGEMFETFEIIHNMNPPVCYMNDLFSLKEKRDLPILYILIYNHICASFRSTGTFASILCQFGIHSKERLFGDSFYLPSGPK